MQVLPFFKVCTRHWLQHHHHAAAVKDLLAACLSHAVATNAPSTAVLAEVATILCAAAEAAPGTGPGANAFASLQALIPEFGHGFLVSVLVSTSGCGGQCGEQVAMKLSASWNVAIDMDDGCQAEHQLLTTKLLAACASQACACRQEMISAIAERSVSKPPPPPLATASLMQPVDLSHMAGPGQFVCAMLFLDRPQYTNRGDAFVNVDIMPAVGAEDREHVVPGCVLGLRAMEFQIRDTTSSSHGDARMDVCLFPSAGNGADHAVQSLARSSLGALEPIPPGSFVRSFQQGGSLPWWRLPGSPPPPQAGIKVPLGERRVWVLFVRWQLPLEA